MLNANRIFFIIVKKSYEAFDFAGPRFIQLLIRKAHPPRACFARMRKHLTTNGHEGEEPRERSDREEQHRR